ncbi:UNVERIFIED_CONTAM: hypothetical protein K2H54_019753 [Gekko kuhli]
MAPTSFQTYSLVPSSFPDRYIESWVASNVKRNEDLSLLPIPFQLPVVGAEEKEGLLPSRKNVTTTKIPDTKGCQKCSVVFQLPSALTAACFQNAGDPVGQPEIHGSDGQKCQVHQGSLLPCPLELIFDMAVESVAVVWDYMHACWCHGIQLKTRISSASTRVAGPILDLLLAGILQHRHVGNTVRGQPHFHQQSLHAGMT